MATAPNFLDQQLAVDPQYFLYTTQPAVLALDVQTHWENRVSSNLSSDQEWTTCHDLLDHQRPVDDKLCLQSFRRDFSYAVNRLKKTPWKTLTLESYYHYHYIGLILRV